MPITINADTSADFTAAVLTAASPLDDAVAALPGLVGAWAAVDYSGSGGWAARIGSGVLLPATTGVAPVKTVREGDPVVAFDKASKAFVNTPAGGATFNGLVVAMRAYFSDGATNFQKVFDLGAPEFFFRSTLATPVWQFAGLGASVSSAIAAPVLGWHHMLLNKSGVDPVVLEADGSAQVSLGNTAPLSGQAMVVGDAAQASSAVMEISRVVICSAGALTAEQRSAINVWVSL